MRLALLLLALVGCGQPLTCQEARALARWRWAFRDPPEMQRLASVTAARTCGTWRPWEP